MNTYKAYKLRIYPTDLQRELIEKTFGCTRYIYNNFLAERKNKYEESKIKINVYEQLHVPWGNTDTWISLEI